MTSFIERRVNEVCGRWLDGFTKDNVEVSLLQAKITLSDLHFKTDELCSLSPALAPSFFYVGQLSIDIPLAFSLNRPLKIAVSDVLAVIRVGDHHGMAPEDARRTISANVHVKALLSRLAAELCGGFDSWGLEDYARKISNARMAAAVHKVVQNMEMNVKGVHVRLEQSEGRSEGGDEGLALGICVHDISLGPDTRARVTKANGDDRNDNRGRWIGERFRKMEAAMFGNVSRYDCPKFDDMEDPREAGSPATLMIAKFASIRGLLVYFCKDKESYSANDRDKTLLRLKEGLKTPPDALPPLLDRCRAGLALTVWLSASQWDKMRSIDVRLLVGYVNIQASDDHIVYLLKWVQELDGHERTLALNAVRPVEDSLMPTWPHGGNDGQRKHRFYRALWRYAIQVVMRDLRSSLEQRAQLALMQLRWSKRASQAKTVDGLPWNSEEREYRVTRGRLWRMWFGEWVRAARYISLRELIHPWLVVEQFRDQAGVVHDKLHEDLHVEAKGQVCCEEEDPTRKLAKYLMPWQLPQEDVDEAWVLITRKCLRWETRRSRSVGAAMQEERVDVKQLRPTVLQALWSIQLEMDAQLLPRICVTSRGMAILRVGLRHRIDCLWQARAEKQRRLRLGLVDHPLASPRSIASSLSDVSEWGERLGTPNVPPGENSTEEGADRVGTLLVRMGQLDGVGGVGLLSLTPKAVATLVLEESSATVEEMNMETSTTQVATYDERNQRCYWDEIFRLEVELDESYVQQLRIERQRKRRASPKEIISSPICSSPEAICSPRNSFSSKAVVTDGANIMGGGEPSGSDNPTRIVGNIDPSVRVPEARCSSFLLTVSCIDAGLFGITQLGTTTLSGKQLTAVPLTAMEHRCGLFSPVAVDKQPRELSFHTVFVPPGDDVARGEQDLKDISENKRLHEILGMEENRGISSVGRQIQPKTEGAVVSISSTSEPADKPPLDSVKGLPLVRFTDDSLHRSTSQRLQCDLIPTSDTRSKDANFGRFSLFEMDIPRVIAVSVRMTGLKVGTYLNLTTALARPMHSDNCTVEQDMMEELTEVVATEVEVCGDINLETGKIAARIGARMVELRDKSLLRDDIPSSLEAEVQQPQLMRAGPVGLELGAVLLASPSTQGVARGAPENGQERVDKQLSMEDRPLREMPEVSTKVLNPLLDREPLGNGTGSSKEKICWDALGSMDKWSFDGRLVLGRFTAELGRWRGGKVAQEVWRRFRFMVSHRSLEATVHDTQIFRGARTDVSGMVTSTSWLLRAGSTSLSLDVEVPQQRSSAQSRSVLAPESPTWCVDMSSSESESESDTETTGVLQRDNADGKTSPNPRAPSLRFPLTFNTISGKVKAKHPRSSFKHSGVEGLGFGQESLEESRSDGPVMGLDLMTKAELIRRVQELEDEVAILKQAEGSRS